jgi:hypothetical protein
MKNLKIFVIKMLLYSLLIICSFVLIIYSSRSYKNVVEENQLSENLIVSLSYLKTKVKMGDRVKLVNYKGVKCLVIDYDEYDNYIYYDSKQLKEIYIKDNYEFNLNDGEIIMTLDACEMEEIEDYFIFTVKVEEEVRKLSIKK